MRDSDALGDALWERFLDAHLLTPEEEDAFLEFVTQPGIARWHTLEDLERLWEAFQERPPKPTLE